MTDFEKMETLLNGFNTKWEPLDNDDLRYFAQQHRLGEIKKPVLRGCRIIPNEEDPFDDIFVLFGENGSFIQFYKDL